MSEKFYEGRTRFRVVKNQHGHFEVWFGDFPVRAGPASFIDRKAAERCVLSEAMGDSDPNAEELAEAEDWTRRRREWAP